MKYRTRASLTIWAAPAAIALAICAICGLGCGSDDAPDASPTPVTGESGGAPAPSPERRVVPIETSAGAQAEAEIVQGELLSDFPSDIPAFPGATPKTSMSVPGQGTLATFSSSSSKDDVLAFYRRELESRGWSVSDGQRGGINATKDGRTAQIKVLADGSKSEIAINLFGG